MARLEPLSLDQVEGLEEVEQTYQRTLGFVPNGLRIMARRPEIAEILAAVSLYGFLNRFNDSLATPLEESSTAFAEDALGDKGWERGKHA